MVRILAYDLIAAAIQARHLQTELASAQWVGIRERAGPAGARLTQLDFDQAPVGRPGRLLGYVVTQELCRSSSGSVRSFFHPLDASVIVSGSAGILDVIEILGGRLIAFVVDGRRVTGFITPSDLNKHPARAHFYLLLADLEMSLAAAVRGRWSNEDLPLDALGARERAKVKSRFKRDLLANVAVDLVTGMDLGHLMVVAGQDASLKSRFRSRSTRDWDDWSTELTQLRNAVMHPVLSFIGPQRAPADLSRIEREVRRILDTA